ncbi:DNA ligase [Pseudoalteromonas byunsanensis]|uniref:DNA ligase n=1 Tax=Pseudoalteromonas byunsanensis TaxID=327939 RepID=A0A1S1N7X6_9GAMM|nr:DNA ligase [Pseudoalteromonas byunsanensis]OHU95526.1 DNA ligase [Pseudoalteromonas byunsanensis]
MKVWILLLISHFCLLSASNAQNPPNIELANTYHENIPVADYLVSEKFDGVRAIWNGSELLTRGGFRINAPKWFTQPFGSMSLDGELWSGYQEFAFVSGLVRSKQGQDKDWRKVRYLVFDAPHPSMPFINRYQRYKNELNRISSVHLQAIKQHNFINNKALEDYYHKVLARGGEGVMLHRKDAVHRAGRSDNVLKYKPYSDAEAIVIGYTLGKGKYQGMTGALKVRNKHGIEFKVGSGLSDKLRQQPPAIGTQITYRYQGFTKHGKPRFARFLRVRERL